MGESRLRSSSMSHRPRLNRQPRAAPRTHRAAVEAVLSALVARDDEDAARR
jgi:hypothetical protein